MFYVPKCTTPIGSARHSEHPIVGVSIEWVKERRMCKMKGIVIYLEENYFYHFWTALKHLEKFQKTRHLAAGIFSAGY